MSDATEIRQDGQEIRPAREAPKTPAVTCEFQSKDSPAMAPQVQSRAPSLRIVGIGTAGLSVVKQLAAQGLAPEHLGAVATDPNALSSCPAAHALHLETKPLRGLGTGGDPERGRALAEQEYPRLKEFCAAEVVFLVAGLGGGAGTGITPVLARAAKEAGALVLGFVKLPFECEGTRRKAIALHGLEELKAVADGVITLPNEKVLKLIDENTSVLDTFRLTDELLADAVRGVWRLLAHPGLIEIHFSDLCQLLRDKHSDSAFAVAEAIGPTRSREAIEKLKAHPLLEGGQCLREAETIMLSLQGGPDLTMAEVNRVVQEISGECRNAQVVMGASIDEVFRERLLVTVIACRKVQASTGSAPPDAEGLEAQLLGHADSPRHASRFVPPPPSLSAEQMRQMANRGPGRGRKALLRLRQTQLMLDIVSKGRFEKSEPTIHKGEDLDVPTFIRRGIPLN